MKLYEETGQGLWLAHLKGQDTNNEFIGFCGFKRFIELGQDPQILYAIREPFIQNGYATEMASALVEYSQALGLSNIYSAVDTPNIYSAQILERIGFINTGQVPGAFGHINQYKLSLD